MCGNQQPQQPDQQATVHLQHAHQKGRSAQPPGVQSPSLDEMFRVVTAEQQIMAETSGAVSE
jgi:hypothetical protein